MLVLCTHNSARSQMAEDWLRHHGRALGLEAEVHSAGTERTWVKAEALRVMAEVGIDLSVHRSKTLEDVPDPWRFSVVWSVCDSSAEVCPVYPATTTRLHLPVPDPSGRELAEWRRVRALLGETGRRLVVALRSGAPLNERGLESLDELLDRGRD